MKNSLDIYQAMSESKRKLLYYQSLKSMNRCPYWRAYYAGLIYDESNKLIRLKLKSAPRKEFTADELAKYNGQNGMPAYAAVGNIVYDVTAAPFWTKGYHFGLYAGKDLSLEFYSCHGQDKKKVLLILPIVGVLKV